MGGFDWRTMVPPQPAPPAATGVPRRPQASGSAAAAPVTAGPQLVKHINRVALLRLLRVQPGLSRADLAQRSGLTRSTVSQLARELIDEGWIAESATEALHQAGRRPTPLRLDGRRLALLGAELAPDAVRVLTTTLGGEVLHGDQRPLASREPAAVCQLLADTLHDALRLAQRQQRQVLGMGIGLPGAVSPADGLLRVAPNFGWRKVPAAAWLRAALAERGIHGLPVLVQNEADLAAIGEAEFGPRPVGSPLVYVSCGVGLGSGIVVGDKLFTGASGAAGAIGHATLQAGGRVCRCGRRGCAEAYIGLDAIATRLQLPPPAGPAGDAALRQRLQQRDPLALAAFAEAGRALGQLLHNLRMVVDPQTLVLGGQTVSIAGDAFVGPARQALDEAAAQGGLPACPLRVAQGAERAVPLGGAALALRHLLQTQPAAERMISDTANVST